MILTRHLLTVVIFSRSATQVVLEPVSKVELDAYTDSEPVSFSLDLICDSDMLSPELTIFGPITKGQGNSLTTAPGENTAWGVGIQVLFNAQAIEIGKPLLLTRLKHSDGRLTLPLAARYHKIDDITPGEVETHLTIKINYP
ncbi:fimbrial protein (plasmid) [Enterobacter mori]|uniref:fimbrial protein n=1 Tax=Enterobacter mori TaxID=539813 RepID=UPI0032AF7ED0